VKLAPPRLELARPGFNASRARVVLFDFDGTISLIRSGWMKIMAPMMIELLLELGTGETEAELRALVEDYVWRLTGQETVYQMIALGAEVAKRGGEPLDPLAYKRMYLDRLWTTIGSRVLDLERGAPPDKYLVPGSRALLERLRERGMRMYLASGTDQEDMRREARLLDIERYFDGGVYGALDDYQSFSKGILIQNILASGEFSGGELLAFGDGYVEIEEAKKVGGVAVGVATSEPECRSVDEWKRSRLLGVGADMIVPNYAALDELLSVLFPPPLT